MEQRTHMTAGSNLHPVFAAIIAAVPLPVSAEPKDDERERFIRAARAGLDGGSWAHHVPEQPLTLQTINAIVRHSKLDAEAKLSAIRAALDVAINDAADHFIGDPIAH